MRISDWSSDVCSSDLVDPLAEVDRGDERRGAVGKRGLPLILAQFGPARGHGLVGGSAEIGELDDQHPHVGAELRAPAGEQRGEAIAIAGDADVALTLRSEEHTSEPQSLMRSPY